MLFRSVLAGGRGRRMGPQPKVLLRLGDSSLVERACRRAAPQVDVLCVSSHLGAHELGEPRLTVIHDGFPGFLGPLAGVCAAMEFLRETAPDVEWLCSFAADTPWFPCDLVARLMSAIRLAPGAGVAVARSDGRPHPVFALWSTSALPRMKSVLASGTDLGMMRFQAGLHPVFVDWPAGEADPFFNINTPEDFERARLRGA